MNLKEIRLEMNMSLAELVRISGIPRRTLEDIERNGNCRFDTACKIADALNIKLDELRKKD